MTEYVRLDLVDGEARPVQVEVSVQQDTVEVRFEDRLVGVADRDALRAWLAHPDGRYDCDEVAWLWSGWAVGLCIRDLVPACLLQHDVVSLLRQQL